MDSWKARWGVSQWAAYFEHQALPVMRRSKQLMLQLDAVEARCSLPRRFRISFCKILCSVCASCARRSAGSRIAWGEKRRRHWLPSCNWGWMSFENYYLQVPKSMNKTQGCYVWNPRAHVAAQLALAWSTGRGDLNPEEVAVASLLGGIGDLLLWVYAPDIPQKAEDGAFRAGCAKCSGANASLRLYVQGTDVAVCRALEVAGLVIQLLRGSESIRADDTNLFKCRASRVG